MDLFYIVNLIGIIALALVLGGMAFFGFYMTPLVFSQLQPETAGKFIRKAFPVFNWIMIGLSMLAALTIWNRPEALTLGLVILLFLFGLKTLMPRINQYRDAEIAGEKPAGKSFILLHRLSVAVHMVQMVMVAIVFIKLVG